MACIGGSQAHGAKLGATDDTDWYGLYIPPPTKVLGLEREEYSVFTAGGKPGGNGPLDVDVCLYTLMKWAGFADDQMTTWSLLATYKALNARQDANFTQYERRLLDEGLYGADFLVRAQQPGESFLDGISAPGVHKWARDRRLDNPNYRPEIKTKPTSAGGVLAQAPEHRYEPSFETCFQILTRLLLRGISGVPPSQRTLATLFRSRNPVFGGSIFQDGIDFSADQNRGAAQVEPEHQDDQRAERAIKQPEITEVTNVHLE